MRRRKRGCHWQSEIRSGVGTLQLTGRSSFVWNWLEHLQCFFHLIEMTLIRDPELTVYMATNLSDMRKVVLSAKKSWKYNRRRKSLFSNWIENIRCIHCAVCLDAFTFMFIKLTLANVVSLVLPVMLLSSSAGTDKLSSNLTATLQQVMFAYYRSLIRSSMSLSRSETLLLFWLLAF